jgi:hypothetical protein
MKDQKGARDRKIHSTSRSRVQKVFCGQISGPERLDFAYMKSVKGENSSCTTDLARSARRSRNAVKRRSEPERETKVG